MNLINLKLISHPMNWIIILGMLTIGGIFGHLLLSIFDQEPASGNTTLPAGLSTASSLS